MTEELRVLSPDTAKVAFIGTGVMGASMAGHLLEAGADVTVFNRTRAKAEPLLGQGAQWADSAGDAAAEAQVTVTMVGFPNEVEDVYLGPDGVVERAAAGSILIDMSTSAPALARRIAVAAANRGCTALDAPVSGGDVGARNATLTIMVGGDAGAFAAVEPVLQVMGTNVILQGGPGAGQHTKLANQVAIAGSMLATVESLAYARAAGLDPERVLASIGAGSAASWSLQNLAPRILQGDYGPGFFVKHFVKDMRLALESAAELGIELPGLECAKRLYDRLTAEGGSELGTQALWLLYASAEAKRAAGLTPGPSAGLA